MNLLHFSDSLMDPSIVVDTIKIKTIIALRTSGNKTGLSIHDTGF